MINKYSASESVSDSRTRELYFSEQAIRRGFALKETRRVYSRDEENSLENVRNLERFI
jgi:hypothetical protein